MSTCTHYTCTARVCVCVCLCMCVYRNSHFVRTSLSCILYTYIHVLEEHNISTLLISQGQYRKSITLFLHCSSIIIIPFGSGQYTPYLAVYVRNYTIYHILLVCCMYTHTLYCCMYTHTLYCTDHSRTVFDNWIRKRDPTS